MSATMANEMREMRTELSKVEADAKQAYADLAAAKKKAKEAGAAALLDKDSDAFKTLDGAGLKYDELKQRAASMRDQLLRIAELSGEVEPHSEASPQQKRADVEDAVRRLSAGQRVVEGEQYKQFVDMLSKMSKEVKLGAPIGLGEMITQDEFKTLVRGGSDTSAGAFVVNDRKAEYIDLNRRPRSILDLVSVTTTDSDTIEWVRQTSRPSSAAFVAEATNTSTGAKPEGAGAWEVINAPVETVAEWIPVTRRAMRDAGRVEALLQDELIYDLYLKLENSMLTGDGTSNTFTGIKNTSGINTYTIGTADATENKMDALHRAITLCRADEEEPDAIMLNPEDWEDLRLAKDDNGNYQYGPPSTAGDMQVWGKRVVLTNAQTSGEAIVGSFRRGAEISFNGGVQSFVADQHSDFFIRNILVLLAEVAAGFLVKRPSCFASVDLEA